jgi:hypothetical protein
MNVSQTKKQAIISEIRADKLGYAKIADKYDVDTDTVRELAKPIAQARWQRQKAGLKPTDTVKVKVKVTNEGEQLLHQLVTIEKIARSAERRKLITTVITSAAVSAIITGLILWASMN